MALFSSSVSQEFFGELVVAWESGPKDDSCFVTHGFRQGPARSNALSGLSLAIGPNHRNARVSEGFNSGRESELSTAIEGSVPARIYAKFFHQIKGRSATCKVKNLVAFRDFFEGALAFFVFDESHQFLGDDLVLNVLRNLRDAVFSREDGVEVAVIKNPFSAGKSHGDTGTNYTLEQRGFCCGDRRR